MSGTAHIQQLLQKCGHYDHDERYMATNDIIKELNNCDLRIDLNLEKQICSTILGQLDDKHNDVQSIAVKCLSLLVRKVQENQVIDICDKLCSMILKDGQGALRDIYSIGLKTCLSDLPDQMGDAVASRLTSKLLVGMGENKNEMTKEEAEDALSVTLECADIFSDLLKRFGTKIAEDHELATETTLKLLRHEKSVVRKRVTACMSRLAVVVTDKTLNTIVQYLLEYIESPKDDSYQRTMIQTIGAISHTVGYRLGAHLNRIIPIFLKYLKSVDDETMVNEQGNELRENILQGLESFVIRCPIQVTDHLPSILKVAIDFLTFDPNYNYEMDEEMEEDDDYEDEDDFEDDDYSDDDDSSWKVRRASIKLITAFIVSRPELLAELYDKCGDLLLSRFKEREENVKIDIITAFTELVRVTSPETAKVHLAKRVDNIVTKSIALLKEKKLNAKSKVGVFVMLKYVSSVLDGGLDNHINSLVSHISSCLQDKNSNLKLSVITFLHLIFEKHQPAVIQPHIATLCPMIVNCINADWYKIVAEALRVVKCLVYIMRPREEGEDMFKESTFDYSPYVQPLFKAAYPRLTAHDIDHEIKECAIACIASMAANLGDSLAAELEKDVLPLLQERLKNEITRMPVLKAYQEIATSPLEISFAGAMPDVLQHLSNFLRQQSRVLKQLTLTTLSALIKKYGGAIDTKIYSPILAETSNLINDSDLHLSHLALLLCITTLSVSPNTIDLVTSDILPKVMILALSPLLHGNVLNSLLDLFSKLAEINGKGATFNELYQTLLKSADASGISKPSIANLAQCIGVICAKTDDQNSCKAVINSFVENVKKNQGNLLLSLLSLGEIGRLVDLSSDSTVHTIIMNAFDEDAFSEDIKTAAATSLGNLACGNIKFYLPIVMTALQNQKEHHEYLLLYSLREIINRHADNEGSGSILNVDQVLQILEKQCGNPEEGVRNMVAECLGKLAIIDPSKVIVRLAALCSDSDNENTRWSCITAIKFAVASNTICDVLQQHLSAFLKALSDSSLSVRRAALLALTSTAHHQPALVKPFLDDALMKILFNEMTVKKELKHKVDLGPFKHEVDDGLPLRKASFTCIGTILDTSPMSVPISEFMPFLCGGLKDVDDIQMMCHQIVIQLTNSVPRLMSSNYSLLLEPLTATLNKTIKSSAVGPEVERANDVIRSALRATVEIAALEDIKDNADVADVMALIKKKDNLKAMYAAEQMSKSN